MFFRLEVCFELIGVSVFVLDIKGVVFFNMNVVVMSGEVVGVIGLSGVGKFLLVCVIVGIIFLMFGIVSLGGVVLG